jgi:NAD(P)-dependent dehydrogenase (short-subunit alcohol dehydrogenase family)
MKIIIFGGDSDIARAVDGAIYISHHECDVRNLIKVGHIVEKYKPDVIINCAGVSYPGTISNQLPNYWQDQIVTNLIGSYNIVRCAKPEMKLIFIASVAGLYGKPNHSAYSISKSGVRILVQSAAKEGYLAYCISPGRVDTKMREKDYPGEDRKTRLTTKQIANIIWDCIKGKYNPGDNIIIRKRGYETFKRLDKGEPWKKYLNL